MVTKILILHLGGTISMSASDSGLKPDNSILSNYLEKQSGFHYDLIEYQPLIDSTEADYDLWYQIAEKVQSNQGNYAGFVVIQGTDTLAYGATALRFFLKGLKRQRLLFEC